MYNCIRSARGKSRQPASQFASYLLLWVAGEEGVAADLLQFPDIMVEEDMGDFVGNVTVSPPDLAERVETLTVRPPGKWKVAAENAPGCSRSSS